MRKSGFTTFITIIAVLVLLILGVLGYGLIRKISEKIGRSNASGNGIY